MFDRRIDFNSEFREQIVDDFKCVERIVTDTGTIKYEASRSSLGHGDIVSSIVLGVNAIHDRPPSFQQPQYAAWNSIF